MNKKQRRLFMHLLLIGTLFAQLLTSYTVFAEANESTAEETTMESSIPKLSEAVDQQLAEHQSQVTVQEEETVIELGSEWEIAKGNIEESKPLAEIGTYGDKSGLTRAVLTRDPNTIPDFRQYNFTGCDIQAVKHETTDPWTKTIRVSSNSTTLKEPSLGVWVSGSGYSMIYYRTDYTVATQNAVDITFTIPAQHRGKQLTFRFVRRDFNPINDVWYYRTNAQTITASQNPTTAGGSITPQSRTYAANGVQASGTATFSLSSVSRSGTPKVLFYTNATTASAAVPNPSAAQASANCSVSGNTLSFTANLTRGTTYYYRYYMDTNYSGIKVYSAYNAAYRITMPNIGLGATQFTITTDGLGFNTDCQYTLTHPYGGTATSVLPANSRIYFYTSLSEANHTNQAQYVKKTSALSATASGRVGISNFQQLEPGITYYWRFNVLTNYSQITSFPGAGASYNVTMPKLTISNPTVTPVGTTGVVNAAINSTLVGTGASYPTNTSKVYVFDQEEKADNKETASAILVGDLSHSGNQMKVDNLSGLQPNKKYWARFYVSSNYSAINDWSEVVEFQTPYAVKEEYYDFSGTYLKEENKTIADGSVYQLEGVDINHSGEDYVYYGWLNASQTPGVDSPNRSPFTATNNTTVKLIYVKKDEAFFLRSVPKLDFGTVDTSTVTQDYPLDTSKYGGSSDDLSVEFLDRRLTSTGWSLKVQLSDLEMNHSATEKLTNATLTMSRKLQLLDSSNNWSDTLPSGLNDYGGGDILLYAGGSEVNVFSSGSASPGDCNGIWRNLIDFNSVKLNVQGGTALKGASYSGKVTWKLDNTP